MAIFMALGIWCKEVRQACFTRNMSKSPNICENAMGPISLERLKALLHSIHGKLSSMREETYGDI
jgi:hypothetical protein